MFKIEGGIIFLHPFKSIPIKEFVIEDAFKNSESFLNSIYNDANTWFEKFPECCDDHKELFEVIGLEKKIFDFIPSQILNNIKYFSQAVEIFIDSENGINEIKDYLEYLLHSFGNPSIGGHVFIRHVKYLIENGTLNDREFSDDQRIDLLQFFEPQSPQIDIDEREIDFLYEIFQNWINAIPNIGQFKEWKNNFEGKVPMDMFVVEPKTNKYLLTTTFNTRSRSELLEYLINLTNDILKISKTEIKKENYDKNEIILIAEERLRIKQNILLNKSISKLESNYLHLIENWLSITIEFYQVVSQTIQQSNNEFVSNKIENVITKVDELQVELSSFCNSENVLKWINNQYPKTIMDTLLIDFAKLNPNEEAIVLEAILKSILSIKNPNVNLEKVKEKLNDPEIAVKHKIKISLPIFLFTKYETELEISSKQKIPKSFKELRELFF